MQQIINFLIKNRNTLLFLGLFLLSLVFTIQSHSYHKSKFVNSTSTITGSVYFFRNNISDYFYLKSYNKRLLNENAKLKNRLQLTDTLAKIELQDSLVPYQYISAQVINSTYYKPNNYLTLNKGANSLVNADMGVVTDLGIVGIIEKTSNNYSKVISILNQKSKINAQLKKTNHFGSLIWDGKNPNIAQLVDIPRLAPLKIGDTIITGGRSTIFPKGISIGCIESFSLNTDESYYTVNVKLFNDMTNLGFVYVIKNINKPEIKALESIDE